MTMFSLIFKNLLKIVSIFIYFLFSFDKKLFFDKEKRFKIRFFIFLNFAMRGSKNLDLALKGPILKWLLVLALPILLGNFLQSAYQFVDAYWVGKLGEKAVAAISISGPIIFFILSLGLGFAMAGTILIAQYAGAKNQKMVNHAAAQSLLTITVVSLFFGLVGYLSTDQILTLMKLDAEVVEQARPFLQISFIGLVFMFLFSIVQSILRGIGEVKLPIYIIAGTVFLNFILDPIFIHGRGIIPAQGLKGAALTTLLTEAIAAVIWLWLLFSGKYGIHLKFEDFKPDFSFIKKAFFLGLPSSLEMSVRSFGLLLLTDLIASFGSAASAGYGAGGNIFQFVLIPTLGLSIATSTMVGQNLGAQQLDRASQITKVSAILAFSVLTFVGALIYVFAPDLVILFLKDAPEATNIGSSFLKTLAFSLGFMWLQYALTGIFRASGNMNLTLMLGIVSMFVLQLPMMYFLSAYKIWDFWGSLDAMRWAFPVTNIIMASICAFIYRKGDWKKKKLIEH